MSTQERVPTIPTDGAQGELPVPRPEALPIDQVARGLQTPLDHGLTTAQATQRLEQFGPNELRERPRPTFLALLLEQFSSFVVLFLIAAAVLSFIIGIQEYTQHSDPTEFVEAGAILAIVLLNAILGIIQERRAEAAFAALRKLAAPEARVLRDGHRVMAPARELVPGDLVLLEAGNFVPADVRLVESVNLKVDESALTGESVPVDKDAETVLEDEVPIGDRTNSAFMGTTVTYGRGTGLVVATGMATQIGHIAEMLQSVEEEQTPLQRRLDQLGKTLGIAALIICGLVFLIGVLRGQDALEMFLIAVTLAVAAVPEGLPAIVTISLALGMREMVQRHALIRRLSAVETLGSATVICSDKTGTLTQNAMTVARLYVADLRLDITGEGYQPIGEFRVDGRPANPVEHGEILALLVASLLANDAQLEVSGEIAGGQGAGGGHRGAESTRPGRTTYRLVGDPTEGALVVAAAKARLWRDQVEARLPRVAEVPFDSVRKRMSTIHQIKPVGHTPPDDVIAEVEQLLEVVDAPYIAFVKGAPDLLLPLCARIFEDGQEEALTDARREHILNVNRELGREALRVLAVAYRRLDAMPQPVTAETVEDDLVLIGLVAMRDPARPEVAPAIEKARHAGIRTAMVTGDYPDTARAIAAEIGLLRPNGQALSGEQIEALDDDALAQAVDQTDVFARVSPAHKVRIVDAFQRRGHVVAMTGDGVNDAPALKKADIGVAMGITGTDVAKETADMVLTDDNYVSIVSAVEQGRIIYSNIRKFVYYLLSCNLAEIAIIFIATLLGLPTPLTPIQLLWLNLVTDGAPALALGREKGDPDIMDRPPRPPQEPVINRTMTIALAVMTVVLTAVVLSAYTLGMNWGGGLGTEAGKRLAETMAFMTLALAELPIAYTARSERYPLLKLGVFSNSMMQIAVTISFVLLMAVLYVPFLQPIFNTTALGLREWSIMLPLIFIPAIAAELTKVVLLQRERRATSTL
jgi:Ca2+-transporting ATPase